MKKTANKLQVQQDDTHEKFIPWGVYSTNANEDLISGLYLKESDARSELKRLQENPTEDELRIIDAYYNEKIQTYWSESLQMNVTVPGR